MVRTKADGGGSSGGSRKAVGASAPRKALGSSSAGPSSIDGSPAGKGKYAGGNPVCPRPTPDWQKGISTFLSPGKSKNKENTEPCEPCEPASSSTSDDGPSTSKDD